MVSIGVLNCGAKGASTGIFGCVKNLNNPFKLILVAKGWSLDSTTETLNEATITSYMTTGKWIVLPEHQTLTSEAEATVYETTDSGYKIFVRNGLAEFMVQYAKGTCFNSALFSLSLGNYDLLIVDFGNDGEARLWGEYSTETGVFKGLDISLLNAETFAMATGTEAAKSQLRIQLSAKGTNALNSRLDFAISETVDLANLDGIRDVSIVKTGGTIAKPEFKVVGACDNTTPVVGLELSDFKVTDQAGVALTPTAFSEPTPGNYTFTTGGSPTAVNIELNGIVDVAGNYYKSDILSFV